MLRKTWKSRIRVDGRSVTVQADSIEELVEKVGGKLFTDEWNRMPPDRHASISSEIRDSLLAPNLPAATQRSYRLDLFPGSRRDQPPLTKL